MNNIMTQFTETELTDIGRAMERSDFENLESFIYAAVIQKKEEVLSK